MAQQIRTGQIAAFLEELQDAVAAMVAGAHTGVSFVYDDSLGILTATVTGGGGGSGHSYYFGKFSGTLAIGVGTTRLYNDTGANLTIVSARLTVEEAPVGASILADVNLTGTTIFTNQAHRPSIASGAATGITTTIDVATWPTGTYLTVDIDQVGSPTTEGKEMTVQIGVTG